MPPWGCGKREGSCPARRPDRAATRLRISKLTHSIRMVYGCFVRTNVDLDETLLAEAAKYSTARSRRRLIHEALATFVAVKAEERRVAAYRVARYRERLERVRGRVAGLRLRSDLRNLVRADRDSR